MNTLVLNRSGNVSAPNLPTRYFTIGEKVDVTSPYYYTILYAGWGTDSGESDEGSEVFRPSTIVVSDTDPELKDKDAVWIQTFPGTDDWTIWIEDGT